MSIEGEAGAVTETGGESGGAADAGGGGTADIIGTVFGGATGDATTETDTAAAAAGGDAAAAWFAGLSAEPLAADVPSNQDWVKAKGFKDLDGIVKSYRETERALRAGGKIEVPKPDAAPEQVEAFHKAIGRPEKPDGYEIRLPEGVKGELDETLLGSFREAAFKAGLPAGMAGHLGDWFIQQQLDADAVTVRQRDQEVAETFREWGGQKDANVALANRAAAKLGLDGAAVADIQKGFGAGRTLKLLQQLGAGLAEDAIMEGGGKGSFGITASQARVELDRMNAEPDTLRKLTAKDPATTARRERLMQAIAAEMDRAQRTGG